jgi:hypothetical protein
MVKKEFVHGATFSKNTFYYYALKKCKLWIETHRDRN